MELIKVIIEGEEHEMTQAAADIASVVIGGKRYFRNGDKVVAVGGRFYRKESPLIKYSEAMDCYILAKYAVETYEGNFVTRDYAEDYYRWCESYNCWAERAKPVHVANGYYITTEYIPEDEETITLHYTAERPNSSYVSRVNSFSAKTEYIEFEGKNYVKGFVVDGKLRWRDLIYVATSNGLEWLDRDECVEVVTRYGSGYESTMKHEDAIDKDIYVKEGSVYIEAKEAARYRQYLESDNRIQCYEVEDFNLDYDEVDPTRGGITRYNYTRSFFDSKNRLTGGLPYTFGIEIETDNGYLDRYQCDDLSLQRVGDGSIEGDEYVTGVLQGDKGVRHMQSIYREIADSCIINDLCSTHIHIGSKDKSGKDIVWNRWTNFLTLKLGVALEKDFFAVNNPARNPNQRYCSGFADGNNYWSMDLSDITPSNYMDKLPNFIYHQSGGFDRRKNKRSRVGGIGEGRWNEGRYKWLNLTHCATGGNPRQGSINTLEFRIWSPTTDFKKAYNFLLISMAFVWATQNAQGSIVRGEITSLEKLISMCYKGDIRKQVLSFIKARREEFAV